MSAVNVLAWLDSLHSTTADGAVTNDKWPEAQQAHAAVAELIEALSAFDIPESPATPRLRRLRAALVGVGGAA